MKKKFRCICILLCACVCFSILAACATDTDKQPVIPTPAPTPTPTPPLTPTLTPTPELVATEGPGSPETLAQAVAHDPMASRLLQTVNALIDEESIPDVPAYTEALITAMVTYDFQNATGVSTQYKIDNFALANVEKFDFESIEKATGSTMLSMGDAVRGLEVHISSALQNICQTMSSPTDRIYAISKLETRMQHYAGYDRFLQILVQNADDPLRTAAEDVRAGMHTAGEITAKDFLGDNTACFFSETAFSAMKVQSLYPAYITDNKFRKLVDTVSEVISTTENTDTDAGSSEAAWKKAYLDYMIEQEYTDWGKTILVHINNDAIPELYHSTGVTAGGSVLCSYADDNLITLPMGVEGLAYIAGQNLFLDSDGRMDFYYDIVYSIENGTFVKHHTGEYGRLDDLDPAWDDIDRDGLWDDNEEALYDYYWDGKKLSSEAEYKAALHAVYDEQQEAKLDYGTFLKFEALAKEIILY